MTAHSRQMAVSEPNREGLDRIRVLRSKNAGPFAWTFDVVFRAREDFEKVRRGLDVVAIARAYAIPVDDVLPACALETLNALKVSVRRPRPAGHPGDSDCYGMNQEEPLTRLVLAILADGDDR